MSDTTAQDMYARALANIRKTHGGSEVMSIRLPHDVKFKLDLIAQAEGSYPATLIKEWVSERVAEILPDPEGDDLTDGEGH